MLLDDFFYINKIQKNEDAILATLMVNAEHPIFLGHFPGQPVVPGVCMMEMMKETMAKGLSVHLRILKSENMKFLTVQDPRINPLVNAEIRYSEKDGKFGINAILFAGDVIFFKLKATFEKIEE